MRRKVHWPDGPRSANLILMIRRAVLAILTFAALPAAAQSPMSAGAFDAYTRGKTFYYGVGGTPYGGEEYLENRRVRWSFLDGACQTGTWYPKGKHICFIYENRPDPQCWTFFESADGLVARFEGEAPMTELYEVEKTDAPLVCPGPEVGV